MTTIKAFIVKCLKSLNAIPIAFMDIYLEDSPEFRKMGVKLEDAEMMNFVRITLHSFYCQFTTFGAI